jgi:hypothetical protein
MGMYSHIDNEDLHFRSPQHKQRLIDEGYKLKCNENCSNKLICISGGQPKEEKCPRVLLESYFGWDKQKDEFQVLFDDRKIISYWYNNTLNFLNFIAEYIEGEISLGFETEEERALIRFTKGKCKLAIGEMKYKNYTPNDLLENR